MNKQKFNLGVYLFGGVLGLLSGLCFSKSMYYKGCMDTCKEIEEVMMEVEES